MLHQRLEGKDTREYAGHDKHVICRVTIREVTGDEIDLVFALIVSQAKNAKKRDQVTSASAYNLLL